MNYTELLAELFARGTDYLDEDADSQARAGRWINQAYREIVNLHSWPFLQATATGAASAGTVSIPDLRKVRFVADIAQGDDPGATLRRISMDDLADEGVNLSQTGTPEFYYITGGNQVNAYPVGGTLKVYYYKRVPALSGTDVPVFDEQYHDLIIDRAMMKAYKDSDNFEAAAALKLEFDAGLASMAEDYQLESREVQFIRVYPSDG